MKFDKLYDTLMEGLFKSIGPKVVKPKNLGEVELTDQELKDLRAQNAKRHHDRQRSKYNIKSDDDNKAQSFIAGLFSKDRTLRATRGKSYTTSNGKLIEK